jgi:hypothetical protein
MMLTGWLKELTEETRERVFVLMREVDAAAQKDYQKAQQIEGNGTTIPVGAAHFDYLIEAVVADAFLRAVRRGSDPTAALVEAKADGRLCVSKHNARRKDYMWQRWDGAGDEIAERLMRRFQAASA